MNLAMLLAEVVTVAPRESALPMLGATDVSCQFVREGEPGRFSLYASIPVMPAKRDPNGSVPVRLGGEGHSLVKAVASVNDTFASEWFRDYQLSLVDEDDGGARYVVNLKLRKAGNGVAYVTRYARQQPEEPFEYYATGMCAAKFFAEAATRTGSQ